MVKPGEESTQDSVRLQYKSAKRSTARKQRKEGTKHLQNHQKYKKKQRRSKGSEQLQIIEHGERAEEGVDGAGTKEDTMHMPEEEGGSSGISNYDAIGQYDANLGRVGLETAATLAFGRRSAHLLVGNPGAMSIELSSVPDVQTRPLAPKPPGNPCDITAMSEFPTMGDPRQASPAADLLMPGKMFREMEAGWYQRVRDLEADLHQRIAYHGRLLKEIKCPHQLGIQAALDELAKTERFQTRLAAEVATRHLIKKDVARSIAGLYHQVSRLAHGNSGMITIFEEDHTPNERAALATFLGVQGEWKDCLRWKEVKRGE
ncbi:hypothetical protein HOY80DRAFT_1067778 [Tuber brumale]|nr:hypothetical protein HOY80DRAFT_1067778 [Tuber brumale]